MDKDDPRLKPFGTRLDQDLIDQIKLLAVQRRKTLQDCSAEAFRAWIATASGHPS